MIAHNEETPGGNRASQEARKDFALNNTTIVPVPLSAGKLYVSENRADQLVALKPACEAIEVDFSSQLKKLRSKPWATVVMNTTVGADGKPREMTMVTRETFTMWLATLEPSRVKESARPTLVAFQKEAAKALDSYFHEGSATNPRITLGQLSVPANFAEALELAAAQAREVEALETKLAVAAPRAEAWDHLVSSAGTWSYLDVAHVLQSHKRIVIGEKRLVVALCEWGMLYRDHKRRPRAYQRTIEQGLFEEKFRTYIDTFTGETKQSSAPQVRITGKGIDAIYRRLTAGTDVEAVPA